MRKLVMLAALGASLAASPAMAKGGLYLGALAGYEGLHVKAADGSASAKADSAIYGIDAGYDVGLGSAFVGVEGELSTSSRSTRFPSTFTGARDSLKASGQYCVGARAGLSLTPGIAAYGKIGYTSLGTKAFTSSGSLAELKERTNGVRYGAGLQIKLPGPLEARAEYRRSDYKDASTSYGKAKTNQVVGGLGVRF